MVKIEKTINNTAEKKPLQTKLNEDLLNIFKGVVAMRGRKMTPVIEQLIIEWLTKEGVKIRVK